MRTGRISQSQLPTTKSNSQVLLSKLTTGQLKLG